MTYSHENINYFSNLPPRSRLYSMAPLNTGEFIVESLPSYLERLLNAHCIGWSPFVSKILHPAIKTNVSKYSLIKLDFSRFEIIEKVTVALSELTGQHDFEKTTMIYWRNVISSKRLLRKHRAWCPLCLEEQIQEGGNYEHLLWTIEGVKACIIHKVQLKDRCYNCMGRITPFNPSVPYGYCGKCKTYSGFNTKPTLANELELRDTEQIIGLINAMQSKKLPPESSRLSITVSNFISAHIEWDILSFSTVLDIPLSETIAIVCANKAPTLSILLRIGNILNIPLPKILFR